MSVSDPIASTTVAAASSLHEVTPPPPPLPLKSHSQTHEDHNLLPGKKGRRTPTHEKSEDGTYDDHTTIIGEGHLVGSRQAFVITETASTEMTKSKSANNSPSMTPIENTSGSGSPMMSKMYLLQRRPSSDMSGRVSQLDAPIDPLLAPLDCPRPSSGETVPAAVGTTSGASPNPADQLNALDDWDRIRSELQGKQLVVFLDYDGTLTPIVSQPSQAIISEAQREKLAALASKCPVAIVTGRKLDTIKKFLLRGNPPAGLASLFYAGSHGFDIDCPGSTPVAPRHSKTVAEEFLPHLAAIRDQLTRELKDIQGALVEDNKFTVSVHYRNVKSASDRATLHARVHAAMKPFEEKGLLRLTQGHEVHEIRAHFDWHKGAAVNYLMQLMCSTLGDAITDTQQIVPVYVGDDRTDEDAFRTLRSYRTTGTHPYALSVFVRADDKARPTAASYVVRSPEEVGDLLLRLAEL